jgi:hypothetical protein
MPKQTHEVKVPCGMIVIDIQGRRVGAGKNATVSTEENKRIEKFLKAIQTKKDNTKKKKELSNGGN